MSKFDQHLGPVPDHVPLQVPVEDVEEPAPSVSAPATGHPQVDSILGRLEGLDEIPVAEHERVFEEVLAGLRSTLAGAGEPADTSG